jgi:hypothetical protein
MATPTDIVVEIVFGLRYKVGMAGTWDISKKGVVIRPGVFIGENYGQWCTGGDIVMNTAHNTGDIPFDTWCSPPCTGFATEQIFCKILYTDGDSRRDTIYYYTYHLPMGLTENRYSEISAETVHIDHILYQTKLGNK